MLDLNFDGCLFALLAPVMIGLATWGLYRLVRAGDRWMSGGE